MLYVAAKCHNQGNFTEKLNEGWNYLLLFLPNSVYVFNNSRINFIKREIFPKHFHDFTIYQPYHKNFKSKYLFHKMFQRKQMLFDSYFWRFFLSLKFHLDFSLPRAAKIIPFVSFFPTLSLFLFLGHVTWWRVERQLPGFHIKRGTRTSKIITNWIFR